MYRQIRKINTTSTLPVQRAISMGLNRFKYNLEKSCSALDHLPPSQRPRVIRRLFGGPLADFNFRKHRLVSHPYHWTLYHYYFYKPSTKTRDTTQHPQPRTHKRHCTMNPLRPLLRATARQQFNSFRPSTSFHQIARRTLVTPTSVNHAKVSEVSIDQQQIQEDPGEYEDGDHLAGESESGEGESAAIG